ncbi:helix-turn-helix transcriptional regulator [Flavobacterium amniphilum]|uniref:helix-turn-helix domain-containing protein n=1 Tax=Flavobacterium amniphilum TaxID=1834035 RepID=UPI00202AAA4D|nr:helix-turn-helix transcriptional regulator [Flavobacterium amniphilum]MCL9805758.1 helix-turn-helix transcriptional regulator [Flavobacterium amniphilum]MCL9806345.1 helix-turn-helix transcriptional regulator [Flavobacterium amniphilum]
MKGIHRPFTHMTSLGYSGSFATKMTHNDVRQMNLDILEKICRDFNCTPNDLIDFKPSANSALPKDHALHSLTKTEVDNGLQEKINTLTADKIQQIHDIIKNME